MSPSGNGAPFVVRGPFSIPSRRPPSARVSAPDSDQTRRNSDPRTPSSRSDLHGIFLRACERAGVELVTDQVAVDFENSDRGARVTFEDGHVEDLTERLAFPMDIGYAPAARPVDETDAPRRYAPVQRWQRLPRAFWSQRNMHLGSHQFLVDDFVKAVTSGRLPPVSAWEAARFALAGITAHESALQDGERLQVPDPGEPPADWARLDPEEATP